MSFNSSPVLCQANDVLLGRGNVRWHGNQQYQEVIRNNAQRYLDAKSRSEKTQIVFEVIGIVLAYGGRFLIPIKADRPPPMTATTTKQATSESSQWHATQCILADHLTIRKKVGQVNIFLLESSISTYKTILTCSFIGDERHFDTEIY